MTVDDHAVPHAVFTQPEIAGVVMNEAEAVAA
jgi:pyruvate/2-oxoglutarate dehydrogenase complex dihydrolipoamide dehydrogenase (E3) component